MSSKDLPRGMRIARKLRAADSDHEAWHYIGPHSVQIYIWQGRGTKVASCRMTLRQLKRAVQLIERGK